MFEGWVTDFCRGRASVLEFPYRFVYWKPVLLVSPPLLILQPYFSVCRGADGLFLFFIKSYAPLEVRRRWTAQFTISHSVESERTRNNIYVFSLPLLDHEISLDNVMRESGKAVLSTRQVQSLCCDASGYMFHYRIELLPDQ